VSWQDGSVTSPIARPLTPPQLAVLQKPPDGAASGEPTAPPSVRAVPGGPAPARGTGRGRLLDIVV
jgi:hypothetical protein